MSEFKKIEEVFKKSYVNKEVKLRGWVYRKRELKDVIFILLRDSSDIIQCTIKKGSSAFEKAKKITTESSIELSGNVKEVKKTQNDQHEIHFLILHISPVYLVMLA